jgi:hypothetical protein
VLQPRRQRRRIRQAQAEHLLQHGAQFVRGAEITCFSLVPPRRWRVSSLSSSVSPSRSIFSSMWMRGRPFVLGMRSLV